MLNLPHQGSLLKKISYSNWISALTKSLSHLINGKAAISAEMALGLELWIGGSTAEICICMQADTMFGKRVSIKM